MPTRRFERIALAQLLVAGCAVVFGIARIATTRLFSLSGGIEGAVSRFARLTRPAYQCNAPWRA